MTATLATYFKVTESTMGIKMGESLVTQSQVIEFKLEINMIDPSQLITR
jgi:hypothetical protein